MKIYENLVWNLEKELSYDKVMIIITGISGSGKSTLMRELQETVSSSSSNIFLSVDNFKICEYEKYGFHNITEKEILKDKALDTFKTKVIMNVRKGLNVIVEYPFAVKWQSFFNYIHDEYGYKLVVVNCNSRDFEEIWRKKVDRDTNTNKRHPALISEIYLDENNWSPKFEFSDDSKINLHDLFIRNYYNSIRGDIIYNEGGWKEEHIVL